MLRVLHACQACSTQARGDGAEVVPAQDTVDEGAGVEEGAKGGCNGAVGWRGCMGWGRSLSLPWSMGSGGAPL